VKFIHARIRETLYLLDHLPPLELFSTLLTPCHPLESTPECRYHCQYWYMAKEIHAILPINQSPDTQLQCEHPQEGWFKIPTDYT
jgi:hypothetical protein